MSLRSGVCRGGAIVGLAAAVVLLVAAAASPAGAVPAANTIRSAVASWVPTGPGTPNVSLQVDEETGPTGSSVFFFVNESYL
jgi:hypothetical protein